MLITGTTEITTLICDSGVRAVHSNVCFRIDFGCTGVTALRDSIMITLHITDGVAIITRLTILKVIATTNPISVPIIM
jgi:hypothetical protein